MEHKPIFCELFDKKSKLSLTTQQKEKLSSLALSSYEWIILVNLVELLNPFYEAADLLSGSKYPTIGLALFTLRNIQYILEREEDDDTNITITLKKYLLDSLNFYFEYDSDQYRLLLVSNFA